MKEYYAKFEEWLESQPTERKWQLIAATGWGFWVIGLLIP